jgi:hypothetical protein
MVTFSSGATPVAAWPGGPTTLATMRARNAALYGITSTLWPCALANRGDNYLAQGPAGRPRLVDRSSAELVPIARHAGSARATMRTANAARAAPRA